MSKIIYFASAIDNATHAEHAHDEIHKKITDAGLVVFDPSAGWTVPPDTKPNPRLQAANMATLKYCDALYVHLRPVLSIGVVLEINEALELGIPTVVYAPGIKPSWALRYLLIEPYTDLKKSIKELRSLVNA